ncbi:hypothetical protein [Roseateles sp.]|uniref:hypothetical protein n=1 Tax=Roseateles sp. TaxID=1971397 RepID=UPI00326369B4
MSKLLTRTLAALALCLAAPLASAALVTYTVQGGFTGAATGDAAIAAALDPLLAGQSLSLTVTLDTAAAGSAAPGGFTLYGAVTASTASFAGFDSTSGGCPSASDFICKVAVHDGVGGFLDPDQLHIFPAIAHADALDAAAGLGRVLELQFLMFFADPAGLALADDGLGFDLSGLNPARFTGQLAVFASGTSLGDPFDRADFAFDISRITTGDAQAQALPEPGSLALGLLALAGVRRCLPTTLRSST